MKTMSPLTSRTANVASMIRVNQAGEFGAKRIYAGQLAVLGSNSPAARSIAHMAEQEQKHLAAFDKMIVERGVRPSIVHPIWNVAGFALGAITAAIGPEAAMACTVAVETEIDRHYAEQLEQLIADDDAEPELRAMIAEFQSDELEHKATALEQGAERAPGYPVISAIIRAGCRVAISVSKRI